MQRGVGAAGPPILIDRRLSSEPVLIKTEVVPTGGDRGILPIALVRPHTTRCTVLSISVHLLVHGSILSQRQPYVSENTERDESGQFESELDNEDIMSYFTEGRPFHTAQEVLTDLV